MSVAPKPDCWNECRAMVLNDLAEFGIEAIVTHIPPIFDSGYEQLDMRCPHGVLWYTEPTKEQIARWVEEGAE